MPYRLAVYTPGEWLRPDDPAEPSDSSAAAAWAVFEDAHRAAYAGWNAARDDWQRQQGSQSIEAAIATPDEPWVESVY
jgi:hypothetical protein